jgi:hypothetical protein
MSGATPSRETVWIVVGALVVAGGGAIGAALVAEAVLLMIRPSTRGGWAARLMGLTTLTTGLVAGLVGGVVGVARGLDYPPTAWFAFIEGGVIGGCVGLLLGGLVGAVLAVDVLRQARIA